MNAIVVVDKNWAIGHENDLLFSLPGDMKHFRTLTTGGTVIMGRKTLDSFPEGKPLPNRRNIVITRNEDFQREGCEIVGSPEAALELAAGTEDDRLWIIGGGSVYTTFLSRCKRVYLTKVDAAAPETDTYFPNLDKLPTWEVESTSETHEENGLTYQFINYVNTKI
jgi:dihydrofolate reductase